MPLSLKQLRYFVAIADAGALSRAAETLSIAQSALSHHIGDMEAALGVRLLERSARGVALTPSGKRLYEHAGAILTALERAESDVRTVAGTPSGPIAIGLCHTAVEVVSLSIMRETRRQWPDIRLTLVEGLSGGLIERVLSGELDFAVAYNPPPDRRLRSVVVLEEQLYLVGVPAIIGAEADPIPFGAIPAGQILGMNRFQTSRSILASQPLRDIVNPNIFLELDSLNAMRKALAAGLGCSILARATVGDLIASGAIHARRIVEPDITRELAIVSLADRPETRASQEMSSILHAMIAAAIAANDWPAKPIATSRHASI
jgi:LysR family transcriptional regulator, nitrogen assimilation regulatory protein